MSLFDQLPRLSAFDPGAVGEGGLDPLGLGALADAIANISVPGIRARMTQPRFVTISAAAAIACHSLRDLTADEGKTTVDIAFEWLVVEAMVRNPGNGRTGGLPGNQKAARAIAANKRLSRSTYLNGPRVFGFTGVYRPFSRDIGVLKFDDSPADNAARLVAAWEHDFQLSGYVDNRPGTRGGELRKHVAETCRRTLEKGECAAPPNGQLLRDLSNYFAPREARTSERRVLRELIATGEHEIREIRNELTARLVANPPSVGITQRDLAHRVLPGTSPRTRQALQATIDYEEAATALDYAFRRFLAYTTQQNGAVISASGALRTPGLAELAPRIGDLTRQAIDSVAALDDAALTNEAAKGFRGFQRQLTAGDFLDSLVDRHEEVQASRKKMSWLDRIDGNWTVRIPYRNHNDDQKDEIWAHPMRLVTLANFLSETQPA